MPMAQLLRATNETMLSRSLQFDSSNGTSLTLDVAGRRILRLTAAIGIEGAESCLGIEVLEDEHKDDLIKLLQALAVPGQRLSVTSGPIGRGGEEVSVGLPVALLADLVLVDLNDPAGDTPEVQAVIEEPAGDDPVFIPIEAEIDVPPAILGTGGSLAAFATDFGPELMAWLVAGGADDGKSDGPEEMVSHLRGFLDDERESVNAQFDRVSDKPGDPVCMMLGASLVEGHSILCVRLEEAMFLGVIDGDGTGPALKAWRSVLA